MKIILFLMMLGLAKLQTTALAGDDVEPTTHAGDDLEPTSHAGDDLEPTSHAGDDLEPTSHAGDDLEPTSHAGDDLEPSANPRRRMSGPGTGTSSDWRFCSSQNPCSEGQGDCDSDDECNGLMCGLDNCVNFNPNAHTAADCCVKQAFTFEYRAYSSGGIKIDYPERLGIYKLTGNLYPYAPITPVPVYKHISRDFYLFVNSLNNWVIATSVNPTVANVFALRPANWALPPYSGWYYHSLKLGKVVSDPTMRLYKNDNGWYYTDMINKPATRKMIVNFPGSPGSESMNTTMFP